MRLLGQTLLVLVLCLTAIALPAAPAQAQCYGPFIELSAKSGLPGIDVIVYGQDFTANVLVDIYYDGDLVATGRASSNGAFTIMITIPEGSSGHYQVLAKGYTEVDTYFTVKPGLTVSPDNGPPGMTVTVEGKGFAGSEEGIELLYYLADTYETVASGIRANAKGSWDANFQVPTSSRGEHKLDAQGALSHLYEVEDALFRITAGTSLDKTAGFVDDNITMTGSRFTAHEKGIQILFDGQPVVTDIGANSEGEWQASFNVPEMPSGEYGITAEGEHTKREDIGEVSFQLEPDIALSPTEGHVGTNLMVTGHGFAASEGVVILYDGEQVTTAETDDKGSFDADFQVPESQYGQHLVAAGYSGQNAASAVFTMESNHPSTPQFVSPSGGSRMGLIGKETPTFQWSAVSDDSGIYYSLQVAASDDLAATGGFADPLIVVTDLTETTYTLEDTEALPVGNYYWIVQAVDGADNGSDWSAARSFRVGLLPLWAFVVIIIAVVVLIGALIRALLVRRSIYYDDW
jgi:hypothetical protein